MLMQIDQIIDEKRESDLIIENQKVYFHTSENMSFIKDNSVNLFITSPPYWNLKNYGDMLNQIGREPYEIYLERLNKVWNECYRVAQDNSVLIININSRRANKRFYPIALDIYKEMKLWKLWDVLIWYVPNALPQCKHYMERLFDNKFEYLLIFTKGDVEKHTFHKPRVPQKYATADPRQHKKNNAGRCIGNVFRIAAYRPPNVKQLSYHVAAYPEELVAFMLETYTNPGDIILDPFLGSGTTLKVAKNMNRNGLGFELNYDYKELIEEKIKEYWEPPDWKELDIIHSSTMNTGMEKPRKIQFSKGRKKKTHEEGTSLFILENQGLF
jgi:DNA modification methylase